MVAVTNRVGESIKKNNANTVSADSVAMTQLSSAEKQERRLFLPAGIDAQAYIP